MHVMRRAAYQRRSCVADQRVPVQQAQKQAVHLARAEYQSNGYQI